MEVHVFTGGSGASLALCCIYGSHTPRLSDLRSDTLCAAFTWLLSYIELIEKRPTVTSPLYWFVHPSDCHLAKSIPEPTCFPPDSSCSLARPEAVNSCKRARLSVIDCNGGASIYPDHGMIKPVVIRPIYISQDEV